MTKGPRRDGSIQVGPRGTTTPYAGAVIPRWLPCLVVASASAAVAQGQARPEPRGRARAELFSQAQAAADTPGARFVASLPEAARQALAKDGQAVLDQQPTPGGPALIRAVARFSRPPDQVFELITRVSTHETFLPHVVKSKTHGVRTPEGEAIDTQVTLLLTFRYRTQHWFYPEQQRMEWNVDPLAAGDLKAQQGFWQLYALDEHTTIGEYGTAIELRSGFINFLRSLGEKGGVRDALTAFRKHVDGAKL